MELHQLATPKEANEGIEIPLYDSAGKATDARIRIRSVDSVEYRKAWARIQRSMFTLRETSKEGSKLDFDQLSISNDEQRAASLIVSWTGIEKDGEPWACTDENKIEFCRISSANTLSILSEAEDRSNFIKKKLPDTSKSSESTSDLNSQAEPENQP